MAFFAAAASSGPSASPCTFAVPALFGAPFPMTEVSWMIVGLSLDALRLLHHGRERVEIVHAAGERVPAVALVALQHVLRECQVRGAFDGDPVGIVEDDELAQAEVTREGRRLRGDALPSCRRRWPGRRCDDRSPCASGC